MELPYLHVLLLLPSMGIGWTGYGVRGFGKWGDEWESLHVPVLHLFFVLSRDHLFKNREKQAKVSVSRNLLLYIAFSLCRYDIYPPRRRYCTGGMQRVQYLGRDSRVNRDFLHTTNQHRCNYPTVTTRL